jgi:hypothetical protein
MLLIDRSENAVCRIRGPDDDLLPLALIDGDPQASEFP